MEEYSKKFKSNTSTIMLCGIVFALAFLFAIVCFALNSDAGPFATVLCIFVGGPFYILLKNYKEITLYEDHMIVSSLLSGILMEVQYSNIRQIGFLNSSLSMTISIPKSGKGTEYSNNESLIILLYEGSRKELDASDYRDLHEVSAFIQSRINA